CSRNRQMDHYAIAFGNQLVNLLVVVRERCPGSFDHGADARVSFAKGVRAIVSHEIRSVKLGDAIEVAAIPDDVGDLAHQPLVLLAHQHLRSGRRITPQAKLQVPSNNAPRSGTTPLASPMFDLFRGANPVAYFARLGLAFPTDVLRATATRMSALNAPVSTSSPSWMSIARLVFP